MGTRSKSQLYDITGEKKNTNDEFQYSHNTYDITNYIHVIRSKKKRKNYLAVHIK